MKLNSIRKTLIGQGEGEIEGAQLKAVVGFDGAEIYVEVRGVRIAVYRGDGEWLTLEPGWKVETSSPDHEVMTISRFDPMTLPLKRRYS